MSILTYHFSSLAKEETITRARYEEVADHLRAAILRGTYRAGQAIPTELELCQLHGVSRPTIRQATRLLRNEGWLEVKRGQGTFVRLRRLAALRYTPAMPRGGPYTTVTAAVTQSGSLRPQGVDVIAAGPREAAWLELSEGDEVIVRRRHLVADDEVIQLYDSYLPLELVKDTPLAKPGFVHGGVYAALARIGHPPVRCGEEVTARMPTPEEAAILQLGTRTPVLEVLRMSREADGRVVEALHIVAAADRNVLVYDELPIEVT